MVVETSNGRAVDEWKCECGQSYRVASLGEDELRLWPRNSSHGYSCEALTAPAECIRCSAPLRASV